MVGSNSSALANGVQRSNARAICTCKHCGKHFKPKATKLITYCSRGCSFAAKAAAKIIKPAFSVIHAGYCRKCGSAFVARSSRRKYCSDSCRPHSESVHISVMPALKVCKCCGVAYKPIASGGRPSEYCSGECLKVIRVTAKRVCKAQSRARLRGATVERVDPLRVFDRDKWKCQLCGVKTPKAKRGTYNDNAPELDHIQPLAKGGDHSYLNTQCACRKCNGAKSDTPMGQTLMFG